VSLPALPVARGDLGTAFYIRLKHFDGTYYVSSVIATVFCQHYSNLAQWCTHIKDVHLLFCTGGPSWLWSYGSWIYNYLCNQYLSALLRGIQYGNNNHYNSDGCKHFN